MKVLVAGATGAMGKQLLPRLVADGRYVVGITRSEAKLGLIRDMGATGVVGDVLDPDDVARMVAQVEPEVIIHQLTALDDRVFDTRHFDRTFHDTNRLRTEGTAHLLEAASSRRGAVCRPGLHGLDQRAQRRPVKSEDDPLDPEPAKAMRETMMRSANSSAPSPEPIPKASCSVTAASTGRGPRDADANTSSWSAPEVPVIGGGAGVWSFIQVDDAADATVVASNEGSRRLQHRRRRPRECRDWIPVLAGAAAATHLVMCRSGWGALAGEAGAVADDRGPRRIE